MNKEIKINKNDLRNISSEFRMYANRLMLTTVEEGMKNLKRFLNFIDKNLIISYFLQKNNCKKIDFQSIHNYHCLKTLHPVPDESPEDEISFIYQLLKYGLQNSYHENDGYWHLAAFSEGYSGGKMKDTVDKFNHNIVKPFIYYIENYLNTLQTDLGNDENAKLTIHFYGNNYGDNLGAIMNEMNVNQSNSSIGVGVNQGEISAHNLSGTINEAEKQNLVEAAAEIQQLLKQLENSYPINTTAGKMTVAAEAIKHIESNPALMQRILSALKAGGVQAFEQMLNHPAASFVIGALEDWQKSKGS